MKDTIVSILIAIIFAIMTLVSLYIIVYALILRRKKTPEDIALTSDKKASETGEKPSNPAKGEYGYCALNEIVGYDIIHIQNIYSEKEKEIETPQTENKGPQTFADAEGIGVDPPKIGTTGRDGYAVTDEPGPTPEELERKRKREAELKRIEEERKRLDEEKKATGKIDNVFTESQDQPEEEDPSVIYESIQDFLFLNQDNSWSESPNEEYEKQLAFLKPDQEDADNPDNLQKATLEEIKAAMKQNDLSPQEQLEMEELLNSVENSQK